MSKDSESSRRDFLKTGLGSTAAALAAVTGPSFFAHPERILGANDRVRVAICGLHGRGQDHIRGFSHLPNVQIAALCDVDENVLAKRVAGMEKRGIGKPQTYVDVRKLLEDKSIDAISIATPNHWHSLMAIWACQAGKDVYVEKPCSHNLWEGRQLVRAAEKYNRMVQHGTQGRSAHAIMDGIEKVHNGLLGEIYMARGLCFKWRDTIGHAAPEPVPTGVHYDLWTGPAPMKPFTRNRFHYNWHWIWDTGNGDLGNQGAHQVDVARWGLGVKLPNRISAIGGHFMFDDDQETPNTITCSYEFDQPNGKRKMMVFEVRHWITNHEAGIGAADEQRAAENKSKIASGPRLGPEAGDHNTIGNIFYGPKGYLATGDEDATSYKTWLGPEQEPGPSAHEGGDHYANFIECVISRDSHKLHAPVQEAHLSCALVHLANASYRLGRTLRFDPETEQVIGDEEASQLLRGSYREPFVVPAQV